MASPLNFKGGFQLTESSSVHTPLLRFNRKSPSIISDTNPPVVIFPAKLYLKKESSIISVSTIYNQHVSLQFSSHSLTLTKNYIPPITEYDKTKMFMIFF